ncbi:MAG: CPBP family intramembrane metalloprotease [Proteobacteria bacterium]|nr:CPBP family intramembrane metalloprotease [Pseudomonadota bacterium]
MHTILKPFEGLFLILVVYIFVNFSTRGIISSWQLLVSFEIICFILALFWLFSRKGFVEQKGILATVASLFLGLWLFNMFRYLEIVRWPLNRVENLSDYLKLLIYHLVFSILILLPVIGSGRLFRLVEYLKPGNWSDKEHSRFDPFLLLLTIAALIWIWAIFVVYRSGLLTSSAGSRFLVIALCKAFLTGFSEEICFRGVLQRALAGRFGPYWAILLQSFCYMLFHIHLGAAFSPKVLFLIGVWLLGLVLGLVTRVTSGIGWAVVVHTAFDVVVECGNIS